MTFRFASSNDYRSIARLHTRSWQNSYRGMLSDDYLDKEVFEERLKVWQERLSHPNENQLVLIAEQNNQVIGFICVFANNDADWSALVDNLHVQPEAKGQGVGKALLQQAASWLKEAQSSEHMFLWVFAENKAACKFYEHLGGKYTQTLPKPMPDGKLVASKKYVWETLEFLLDA